MSSSSYEYRVLPCCLDPLRNTDLPMYTTGQYMQKQVPICYNYVLGPPVFIENPPVPYKYFYWYGDISTPDPSSTPKQ
jgi:hypothetical protein